MSKDATKQYLLGACAVTLNSVNLGFMGAPGPSAKLTFKEIDGKVADFDDVPVNKWITLTGAEVDLELTQTEMAILATCFPGLNKVTSGSNSKLQFGFYAGKQLTGVPLVITPIDSTLATFGPLTIYKAVPVGSPEIMYHVDKPQTWKVKFKALADTSKSDGNWVGTFGDTSITADAVAPTVSSVVPADNATGVATSSTVVWVASEALDPNTVNTQSVVVSKNPIGVGVPTTLGVAGTVTLSVDGLTITFTPTVALTSAAVYIAALSTTIKDLAGNRIGGGTVDGTPAYVTNFTCA